ncbi:Outer membrane protein TolC [Pseudarcicella hirudinis]|uniref:Outer membrane protein TolC n=1 Tax=Pseudarcicella hirudinis TaxID=1079859 RepID=A0A1I5WZ58_9BACT|nr:TolC family protein [Pseudarcicella hirudinis]SFQ24856.1 Outer membrane protein TolC [Pseudarcicella hirudinis]
MSRKILKTVILSLCLFTSKYGIGQTARVIPLNTAIEMAIKLNPQTKIADLRIEKQRVLLPATRNFDSPELLFQAPTSDAFRPGIMQKFAMPQVYNQQKKAQESQIRLTETEKQITSNILRYNVKTVYNELRYLREVIRNYQRQDSLLADFVKITDVRVQVGQISRIEKLNAESQYREVQYLLDQIRAKVRSNRIQLGLLIGMPNDTTLRVSGDFDKLKFIHAVISTDTNFVQNPLTGFYRENQQLNMELLSLEKKRRLPNVIVGYLNQGDKNSPVGYRFQLGVTLPVWGWVFNSRINGAKKDVEIAQKQIALNNYELQGTYDKAVSEYRQYQEALEYYETIGLLQASEIINAAKDGYRLGSIGYYNYLLNLQQAFKIRLGYLDALRNFNQSVITLQYLKGE